MAKKYDEHPLGELSDEQLDQILENYISSYSAENHKNIVRKTNLKKKTPIVRVTFTKRKLLMVAVLLLFFIPVGTYVAAKLWDINIEKQGYELTTKIDKPENQQPDTGYYRLVAEYVPDYLTVNDEPHILYFYEDWVMDPEAEVDIEEYDNARYIMFNLYDLKDKNVVTDEYVKDFKEIELSDKTIYTLKKTDTFGNAKSDPAEPDSIARVFFEKQNMFVEMECRGDIPEKEIVKIADSLHLVNVATMEEATMAIEYETLDEWVKKISVGLENPDPLDINNKSEVAQLNEAITTVDISGLPTQEITVNKVTLSDKITPESLTDVNNLPKPEQALLNVEWDKSGNLKPFTAVRYSLGEGKSSVNEKIEEIKITPKYLEIEVMVKNITENSSDLILYAPVERLAKQEEGFLPFPTDTFLTRKVPLDKNNPSMENLLNIYYPLPAEGDIINENGDEEVVRPTIAPGETVTVTVSYMLASEDYSNLFLNLNSKGQESRFVQLTH